MVKTVMPKVCVFDSEFIPDPVVGARTYHTNPEATELAVVEHMYAQADPEWSPGKPKPMLKSFLYRVVSVSAIVRTEVSGVVKLALQTLPEAGETEAEILSRFFAGVGRGRMQLVGYASRSFDLPVMAQRALIHGLTVPEFFDRPAKPWEGPDYLQRNCDYSVDLIDDIGTGDGKTRPKLDHIARACGIPGKLGMQGEDVEAAWFAGKKKEIVEYNECDACTTYLLWARMCHLSGLLDYQAEAARLLNLLERESKKKPHLLRFIEECGSV